MTTTRYKTTHGTIGRVFNGKKYLLTKQEPTKAGAKDVAGMLRKQGWLARVVPNDISPGGDYRWLVYRREKR